MTPRPRVQEDLCLAYLRAVCASAGTTVSAPPDYGVDVEIGYVVRRGGEYRDLGHRIGVQAKASTMATVRDGFLIHDLEARNYRDLIARTGIPRILVVLAQPTDEALWFEQTSERVSIGGCAYWAHLRGGPPVDNVNTVRVMIPVAQRLDVEAIQGPLYTLARRIRLR